MKKVIFFVVWFLTVLLVPYIVLKDTPISYIRADIPLTINFFQRIFGILAFVLIFWQIVLGAFMGKWVKNLGSWLFLFHRLEGTAIFLLIILHPALFGLFRYKIFHVIDPFYIYTQFCALCDKRLELYYSFGRYAFWLVTFAVLAAVFKTADPWLKKNWRKAHIVGYAAFFLVAAHLKLAGTDAANPLFVKFFWPAVGVVGTTAAYKLYRYFKESW
jgi:hypothetical protein